MSLDVWDDQTSSGPVNWDSLGIIGSFSKDMKELYVPWDSTTPSESFKVFGTTGFFHEAVIRAGEEMRVTYLDVYLSIILVLVSCIL